MSSDESRVAFSTHQISSQIINTQQLRLFVGTWNVGGRAPTRGTSESMQDWLMGSPQLTPADQYIAPADIYVMGFQEIVPLNAQNVLGKNMKDGRDAALSASYEWETLISSTLNRSSASVFTTGNVDGSARLARIPTMATASILHEGAKRNDGDATLNQRSNDDMNNAEADQHDGGNWHSNVGIRKCDVDNVTAKSLDQSRRNENNAHDNYVDSGGGAHDFYQSRAKFDQQEYSKNHKNGQYLEQHSKLGGFVKHLPHSFAEHMSPMPSSSVRRCAIYSTPRSYRGIVPFSDIVGPHGCSGTSADTCKFMYRGIARKHMVGLFISVWVRSSLHGHVKGVQVSSVGCGIMNRLGNKGSVSVSLSVHDTSFCFICTHLRSGDKPSDASRRNVDVNSILRRTRFSCSGKSQSDQNIGLPDTIRAHDRIIWLGDLNYRLTLPSNEVQGLLAQGDWRALIESDELKNEKLVGGVFEGWHEGAICFAPTYKYKINTDTFSIMVDAKRGSQRRSPAWCDRILWYGKGLKQESYSRCESKHSDHRPVRSYFLVEVESMSAQIDKPDRTGVRQIRA